MQCITYLDKGKMWSKAVDLIKELRIQYEQQTYEFSKLADLLVSCCYWAFYTCGVIESNLFISF